MDDLQPQPKLLTDSDPTATSVELTIQEEILPVDSPLENLDKKVLALVSIELLEKKIEDLTFLYTYPLCFHIWVNSKQKVEICTNKAGLHTKHEGKGKCSKHESNVFKARSPYVEFLKGYSNLQSIFETFQNREKKLNDLSDEVNLARTVLAMQLQRMQKDKHATNDAVFQNVVQSLELIRRIIDTIAKVHHSEAVGITMESITAFLWQISEILNQELLNPQERVRILDRIALETSFGS